MSFVQRVVSWLANEVLIDRLANSVTFQKFAVRTDHALRSLRQKGSEVASSASSAERDSGSSAFAAFREELRKGMKDLRGQ